METFGLSNQTLNDCQLHLNYCAIWGPLRDDGNLVGRNWYKQMIIFMISVKVGIRINAPFVLAWLGEYFLLPRFSFFTLISDLPYRLKNEGDLRKHTLEDEHKPATRNKNINLLQWTGMLASKIDYCFAPFDRKSSIFTVVLSHVCQLNACLYASMHAE